MEQQWGQTLAVLQPEEVCSFRSQQEAQLHNRAVNHYCSQSPLED